MKWALIGRPGRLDDVALNLVARGHLVARINPARPAWKRSYIEPLGIWKSEHLFAVTPRTWLPVLGWWPFNGEASWKGSERFSSPRTGQLLREAGFSHIDAVVVASWEMPPLIRYFQARTLVVLLDDNPAEDPALSRVARRRFHELVTDADLVAVTSDRAREVAERYDADEILTLSRDDKDWKALEHRLAATSPSN